MSSRERTARGSAGSRSSRTSAHTWRRIGLGSLDGQQGPMASEAGAERRHPPPTARRAVGKRCIEDEVNKGAAQIAVLSQGIAAVVQRLRRQPQALFERDQ